jgi:hypothetical protein
VLDPGLTPRFLDRVLDLADSMGRVAAAAGQLQEGHEMIELEANGRGNS